MAEPPTHFLKFIRAPFSLNLSIPKSFLRYLNGERRRSKATLRRGGHKWTVDFTDGSFFGDGWRRCVRDNGIEKFDIIVFEHKGNMVFDFLVFDPSFCEKEVPNPSDQMDVDQELLTESESEAEEEDNHDDYEEEEEAEEEEDEEEEEEEEDDDDDKEKSQLGDDCCFITKITPYFIKSSRLANVPLKFARSNGLITKWKNRQVIIRDETRRTWPAALTKIPCNNNRWQVRISICREFKVKNHLQIGDTCKFELDKRGEVVVFDFHNLGKKPIKNLYFTSTLKPWNFKKWILHLPINFVRSNGLKIGKMILRDDESRTWEVLLKIMDETQFYIGCGFRAFLVANELKEGDTFKFELVENQKNKTPVVNFSCKFHVPINSGKKEIFVPKEESSLCEDDDHPRPYFVSKLKSHSIKNSILYLPTKFARKNGLFNNRVMILKNGKDERSWVVELKNHKNKYCYIGRGWKDFHVANGLKEGDRFKLQIIKNIGEKLIVSFYVLNDRSTLA